MNSPSTNVAVMYSSENKDSKASAPQSSKDQQQTQAASTQPSIASLISDPPTQPLPSPSQLFNHTSMPPPPNQSFNPDLAHADLLLNLSSPFPTSPRSQNLVQQQYGNAFGGDMVIDTQDVDMSLLGADMMPWDLEYLPHDMLYYGEDGG